MRRTITLFAALALMAAGPAWAQKIDANGRCHDASGKFAKAEVCGGASSSKASKSAHAATSAAAPASATASAKADKSAKAEKSAKADKPAKCRDAKGKYTKCPA
jgi:hypothetical protein